MARSGTIKDDRLIRLDAPPLGHIPAFDGFRGAFVLLVVLYHAQVTPWMRGMPIIIDWFFISSGFLITSLMLEEKHKTDGVSLRNFYTRRVLRLFPAMYAFLACFSIISIIATKVVTDPSDISNWWVDALSGATYVYNFVAAADPKVLTGAMGHIWSLTVEEQFYFLWPMILVAVLGRMSRKADLKLITGSVVFIAVFIFIRMHFQYMVLDANTSTPTFADENNPTWAGFIYRFASMRPDMIVYGCLIAILVRRIPRPIPETLRRVLVVAGPVCWTLFFAVLLLADRGIPGFELFGGPVYQIALLALGIAVLDSFLRPHTLLTRSFTFKPMRWLGVRAYGIYLWHVLPLLILLPAMDGLYGAPKLALGLVGSALGVLAGLASFRYIERRFLRMKDRFSATARRPTEDTGRPDGTNPVADAPAGNGSSDTTDANSATSEQHTNGSTGPTDEAGAGGPAENNDVGHAR